MPTSQPLPPCLDPGHPRPAEWARAQNQRGHSCFPHHTCTHTHTQVLWQWWQLSGPPSPQEGQGLRARLRAAASLRQGERSIAAVARANQGRGQGWRRGEEGASGEGAQEPHCPWGQSGHVQWSRHKQTHMVLSRGYSGLLPSLGAPGQGQWRTQVSSRLKVLVSPLY